MAEPYKHPVDDLIATAEETARILLSTYQSQLKHAQNAPYWEEMAAETYRQMIECKKRIEALIQARERALGQKKEDSDSDTAG